MALTQGSTILASDITSANTASTIVMRDASKNFSAGTITASLTGHASEDLSLTGGKMSGRIYREGVSTNWNKGRDNALVATSTLVGYSPFASVKTDGGSWDIGAYNHSSYTDDLVFSYVPDTVYNGGNTTPTQIKFLENGHIVASLDGNANTATTSTWATLLKPINTATTASASTWGIPSGSYQVWGERFSDTRLKYTPQGGTETTITDTGDWTMWLSPNGSSATLNMRIDGTYFGSFSGNLSGAATSATNDANGNDIRNKYVNIYNIAGVGGSSAVTFTDLAQAGCAVGMIYPATDNPTGAAGWVHALSLCWTKGSSANWISQIAMGVNAGEGLWYRTTSGNIAGKAWKKVLDSDNYTDQIKYLKLSTRIYPLVKSQEHAQWYKITFPFYNAETGNAAKWFMNSFDLHIGGGYNNNPHGTIHVSFYWTRAASNGAWSVLQSTATAYGVLMNKINLYYRIAEPGVLYVNNNSNNYNGVWIDNLFVDDTSPNLDWSTTTIVTCNAITANTTPALTDYSSISIIRSYYNASNEYIIDQPVKTKYLTLEAQNATSEGGELLLAAAPSNGYPAYLDVNGNNFRIHSKGTARFTLDLSSGAISSASIGWGNVTGKPSTFAPSAHTHSADDILNGYLNTHGENNGTIIPFANNRISFIKQRGGNYTAYVTTSTDYTAATLNSTATINLDNAFDGKPQYAGTGRVYTDVIAIDITCPTNLTYTQKFYIDFGAAGWRAKIIKVLVRNSADETTYTLKGETSTNALGHYVCAISHRSGTGFNQIRVILGDWANQSGTDHRIAQIGVISYSDGGMTETLMSRGSDDPIWRSFTPATTNIYNLGSSDYKWANVYATNFKGNADTATTLQTSRNLWGNSFNGSADIGGSLTPAGSGSQNIGTESNMWNNLYIRASAMRHLDAAPAAYVNDSELYIGYGSCAPTKKVRLYYSANTSSRTQFFEVNSNGAYALTRFGVNGQTVNYNFYVNGSSYFSSSIYQMGVQYGYGRYVIYNSNGVGDMFIDASCNTSDSTLGATSTTSYSSIAGDPWIRTYYIVPRKTHTYATAGDPNSTKTTTLDKRCYVQFREYSYNSNTLEHLNYLEAFTLPSVDADRTSHGWYSILTTKNTITIAQGGTGATDAATARTNLGITLANLGAAAATHSHPVSQLTWAGGVNLATSATADNQEWSIDLTPGSYTGTYWHVWSTPNSKSILSCYPDDNSVVITNGPLTTGTLILNRSANNSHGRISYYNKTYTTWMTYMSNVGNGLAPTGGKPSQLGNVTSWAMRSLIENSNNFGWIWEACANGAASANTVEPTARMALSSNTGQLRIAPNASSTALESAGLIIDGAKNASSGNVALELWRGNNASWQIANEGGNLYFRNNWTTAKQTTYTQTSISINYNTGNTTFAGSVTATGGFSGSLSGNATSATTASKLGSSNVGSARQPIYLNAGSPTAANYTVAHLGNANQSNMNDVGKLHASMGMAYLSAPGNTVDNPGNKTGWHHYIDIDYSDDPSGTNAWVTQFANQAGTTDLWMRSRSGGSITNGTAWAAPWVRVLTESNMSETLGNTYNNNSVGLNLLPQSQDMQGYSGTENRADTPFPWCYSHTITGNSSGSVDCAYNNVVTPEANTWYTLSYWAKASASVEIINHLYGGSGTTVAQGYNSAGATTTAGDGNIKLTVSTEWKHYWVCYKTGSNSSGSKHIIFGRLTQKDGIILYIALPKFEKGQIATGWTPNPGDAYHIYGRTGNTNLLYNGGGGTASDQSLILHGNSTNGSSGIAFVSGKGNTTINYPSDRAFIQFHPYGITTYTAEGTAPTLATSGEAATLVIGVGNDATDTIHLQTPGRTGLYHQVGASYYTIPDTNNTTGSVGGTTTPVYVDGGIIKTCTAYASATVGTANNLSYTLATTTKYYIAGTTLTATGTSGGTFDTGIYATTTAGQLNATTYLVNEKVKLEYNSTDQSLDFIFI